MSSGAVLVMPASKTPASWCSFRNTKKDIAFLNDTIPIFHREMLIKKTS
uniref:Uncharacterized protein n=1 Tax=Anguilla anguilla TaxID=7936 RepID=A0A0E9PJL9_ANGAN